MDSIMNKLRNLDAYPKINEDFYSRTLSGGVITLASSILMLLLFFSELRLYLHAATETTLVVDTSRGETLRINPIGEIHTLSELKMFGYAVSKIDFE
ncbi:endoplasmic reticulum-golgi intermediate compartment protein 3-like [Trifolium pratense]|uniref:Endoplasmic reticulum-golgi intermediate compartment protein 3-like n=1 Tax=Trifolium pratense TaxID=57577 RepID=A0A2K3KFZ4_TRIPR|nr:endoplasmic reticulum-golgi intermediate compartment protein 3-like [Trifolium pratense]